MFLPADLDVNVFVIVLVQACDAAVVAEPEVDGISVGFKGDAGPRDVFGDVREEIGVFVVEVVVFWDSLLVEA